MNAIDTADHLMAADFYEEKGDARSIAHAKWHRMQVNGQRAPATRTLLITETSNTGLPHAYMAKGFARKRLRVVECRDDQNGYKSERGVRIVWESEHYDSRSRGPQSNYRAYLAEAREIAERETRRVLGVDD